MGFPEAPLLQPPWVQPAPVAFVEPVESVESVQEDPTAFTHHTFEWSLIRTCWLGVWGEAQGGAAVTQSHTCWQRVPGGSSDKGRGKLLHFMCEPDRY